MKPITSVALLAMTSVLALQAHAMACTTVQTTNTTSGVTTVVLALQAGSTQADVRTFQVSGMGAHLDTLNLGPRSESGLVLNATVTQGTVSGSCQMPMPGCFNAAMTISMIDQGCPTPVVDEDDATCKHDNGNHWGEYNKLGMTNVPPHSGKPNMTKPCKIKTPHTPPPPTGTCRVLTCTFVPHE